jgi:putative addiction module antidote
MTTIRVTESGVALSQDILAQMGVIAGDNLQVIATADGLNLKKVDPVVEEQMLVSRKIMDKRHDVLRRLAE